ncbi:DNA-3-methyladenine glycosylase I [Puniceicoccales bacterium CK1056]|uniref:DNA-3-methyladenine glycosylase I n=1 Tax=Oceanipulchritudo coccoides TaxID=2706888 RepID=A0A6B2M1U0_9BACT|nr:DNA-3-methyladenine glycosylase I [Oceanipulchritudo coccoides]NDV61700.1 DNA-3-methyladenine glycosylase I [Oceanipulchritudo coccoides]
MKRCDWCHGNSLYEEYHDKEWGVPVYDDQKLFEFIILEGAQAGLSWLTILKRRENYRSAFAGFDPEKVASFTERDQERLRSDEGIIRNRLKISSAISNARCFLEICEEHGSFSQYIWKFVDGRPLQNRFSRMSDLPASTPISDTISKEMKRYGFKFFGTTICYAHMQATGMVNDHIVDCPRHRACAKLAGKNPWVND